MEGNYFEDKKLIGGTICSRGFAQQDLVAIRYLFSNLDAGLDHMSFETEEDLDDPKVWEVARKSMYKNGTKNYYE